MIFEENEKNLTFLLNKHSFVFTAVSTQRFILYQIVIIIEFIN